MSADPQLVHCGADFTLFAYRVVFFHSSHFKVWQLLCRCYTVESKYFANLPVHIPYSGIHEWLFVLLGAIHDFKNN
jgi:hypothetical protein